MELLEFGESAQVAYSLVGDAILACVSNSLPKSRLVSLLSAAMFGSDSSPMVQLAELMSIDTKLEFSKLGQSTD